MAAEAVIDQQAAWSWDRVLDEIVALEAQCTAAEELMRAERLEREAEAEPRRKLVQDLRSRAQALRAQLRQDTVQAIAARGGRSWGAIKLQFRPKVRVLDPEAAAHLLEGVMIVGAGGVVTPLVEWRPVINEDAARLVIEALEGIKPQQVLAVGQNGYTAGAVDAGAIVGLPDAARATFTSPQRLERHERVADTSTVRGWAGVLVLTRMDDPESYVLQIDSKALNRPAPSDEQQDEEDG